MKRLAVLYPPCGGEYEYYLYGEALVPAINVNLMGARYHGGDNEHQPTHMRGTASLENLLQAARVMRPLNPDAIMWACTSGSFISGLAHAEQQVSAMRELLDCPASSTSLAFVAALRHLGMQRVSVLGSYPEETTTAFTRFMTEAGMEVCDYCALDTPSGPHAALLGDERLLEAAVSLDTPEDAVVLLPDTAMPTMHLIPALERATKRTVLTANQVSIWEGSRLLSGADDTAIDLASANALFQTVQHRG
jgi:maleate cis-trans isomerase